MARRQARVGEKGVVRIFDWSGGENNAVNPALLNDNESAVLENYVLDDKGTLFPRKGAKPRYAAPFDNSPVAGMEAFYRSDGVSKLLIGTESGKLYVDTPHLVNGYDSKDEWETGKLFGCLAHADGKVRVMRMKDGFERGTFDDWHVRDTGWIIVTSPVKSGAKAAQATAANQKLTRELGHNAAQTYICVYAYFGENNQDHFPVKLISPSGTEVQAVVAASDGHFKYHNGTALANFPTDKTYAASTWYKIEVYHSGGTFWVGIDDVCVTPSGLTLKDTANNVQTQVAKVTIQNAGSNTASMTVDDVEISSIPAVFSRSSVAYLSNGTQVAANVPRYEAGKFAQAWFGEEGTTNLVNNPSFESGTTGWALDFKGTATWSVVTGGWHGGYCAKVVTTGGENDDVNLYQSGIAAAAGDVFTLSAYCKGTRAGYIQIIWKDSAGATISYAAGPTFTPSSTAWNRYIYTTPAAPSGTASLWVVLRCAGIVAGEIYWDAVQLEKKPYATSFIDGTRSAETLTIPTAGVLNPQEGTVEFIWIPQQPISGIVNYNTSPKILQIGNYYQNNSLVLWAYHNVGTEPFLRLYVKGSSSSAWSLATNIRASGSGWYTVGQPIFLALKWQNGNMFWVSVNGTTYGPYTISDALTGWAGNTMWLGSGSPDGFPNALYDDLRISSRARTDEEIAAAYQSGLPLAVDEDTTYKMNFDNNLNYANSFKWTSPIIDATQATNKASGHAGLVATTPGSSTVTVQSRSAPSQTGPWSSWYNALLDGTLQHPADNFVQVKLLIQTSGEDEPMLDKLTVSFDGTPSVTLLASDFTAGGQFYFAVLQDKIGIVNGLDAPRKYDGETLALMGGNPPHASQIAVHKNRWWLARGSRLYFSDHLDIDTWPVLNFIDINPNDGDFITGLRSYGDYLVIAKQHSTWLLTGEGINTFAVRRIHAGKGAYAPRSLIIANEMVSFVMADGIYFSDLSQAVMMSERERQRWNNLNARRIDMAASWFARQKLYVGVPDGTATRNSTVIVFDTLRQAFVGAFNWKASCWCKWRESGKIVTLFGSSENGQVYEIEGAYSDGGAAYTAKWRSKDFHFGLPEIYKRYNKVYLQIRPGSVEAQLNVYFYVDGVRYGPIPIVVPASVDGLIHSLLVLASRAGVIGGRYIAIEIQQNVLNNPVGVQLVTIEYLPVGVKPTIYS